MPAADYGVANGWAGLRSLPTLVNAFPDTDDGRYLFYTDDKPWM